MQNYILQLPRYLSCVVVLIVTGCVSVNVPTDSYDVSAYDQSGQAIKGGFVITTNKGRDLYSARNALCSLHKEATVEIKSRAGVMFEKPYKC